MTIRTAACAFHCLNFVQTGGGNVRDTELESGEGFEFDRLPKQGSIGSAGFSAQIDPISPTTNHLGALGVYIYSFDIHFRRFLWIVSLL